MSVDGLLAGLVGLVLSLASVVLHEVGHLLCGWLSGYRLVMFHVFFLRIYRVSGRWRAAWGTAGGPIGGQCLMEPTVTEDQFRYRLYMAGGFLMNFVLAAISGVLLLVLDPNGWAKTVLVVLAAVNAIIGLGNAIPLSFGVTNDGADLVNGMRSRCGGRDLYRMLMINAFMAAGGKVKDIDASLVGSPTDPPCDCMGGRARMMFEAQQVDVLGDHVQASQMLNALLANEKGALNRAQLLGSILYNHLVYGVDSVPVPDLADPALRKMLKLKFPGVYQIKAAISYYIEHDQVKALKELDEAERTLPILGNAGMIAETKDELDMLRARFTVAAGIRADNVEDDADGPAKVSE